MNKLCIVILILGLIVGGNSCSRSAEKSEEELNVMEREMIEEERVFEEEKKLEEETKAMYEKLGKETEVTDEEWGDDESPLFE